MLNNSSFKMRDTITSYRGKVIIDTCLTTDCGYETMVFKANPDGTLGESLDSDNYFDKDHAVVGHMAMIEKWRA